jgi:hypothetical protein
MAAVTQDVAMDYAQQAREKMRWIMEVARQRGEAVAERLTTTSRALIDLTTTIVTRAKHVQARLTA